MKRILFLIVLIALTGCLVGGVSPDDVRDGYVESNTTSYSYNSTTTFEISAPFSPVQTTTFDTTASIDRANNELRVNSTYTRKTQNRRQQAVTTTYLVNGSVYSRTVRNSNDTGWVRFDRQGEVNKTWNVRDSLALYTDLLRNASVEDRDVTEVRGIRAHRLSVELDPEERTKLFLSKFSDQPRFFERNVTVENFNLTVWISEDSYNLLQAETTASLTGTQVIQGRTVELNVNLRFVDEFYYEDVDVRLPRTISNSPSNNST